MVRQSGYKSPGLAQSKTCRPRGTASDHGRSGSAECCYILMKRRTFQRVRAHGESANHHNVYVVLLDPAVLELRRVRAANPARDPNKPCVYVGMSGLKPEERFANHKQGIKAASVVKRYGIR